MKRRRKILASREGAAEGGRGIPPRPSESDLLKKGSDFVKQTHQIQLIGFFFSKQWASAMEAHQKYLKKD